MLSARPGTAGMASRYVRVTHPCPCANPTVVCSSWRNHRWAKRRSPGCNWKGKEESSRKPWRPFSSSVSSFVLGLLHILDPSFGVVGGWFGGKDTRKSLVEATSMCASY